MVNSVKDKGRGRFNNNKRGAHGKQANSPKSELCFRCNGSNHASHECRFRDAVCHACKRTGHIATACQKTGTLTSTNVVNAECSDRGTPQQTTNYSLFSLSSVQHAFTVEVKLDGNPIQMILVQGCRLAVNEHFVMFGSIKHHF